MIRPGQSPTNRCGGFSYVEALVVMAVFALIASIGIARLSDPRRLLESKRVVAEIQHGLSLARNVAITRQSESALLFDVTTNRIAIDDTGYRRQFGDTVTMIVTVADSEVAHDDIGSIRFFRDGSSTGGNVAVEDAKSRTLLGRIRIDWLTGRSEIVNDAR